MTVAEYNSIPLPSSADAVAVVSETEFDEIIEYILDGPDTRVKAILQGLWALRDKFAKDRLLAAVVCALFPRKGWMRRTTSASAIMMAKALSSEVELQNILRNRWSSVRERDCNEIVLGISGSGADNWVPFIAALFQLNSDNDVRTQLLKAMANLMKLHYKEEWNNIFRNTLAQMPTSSAGYGNVHNYEFICSLRNRKT